MTSCSTVEFLFLKIFPQEKKSDIRLSIGNEVLMSFFHTVLYKTFFSRQILGKEGNLRQGSRFCHTRSRPERPDVQENPGPLTGKKEERKGFDDF